MNRLTLAEFRSRRAAYDEAVAATGGLCGFCSGSAWQLAAYEHLRDGAGADRREWIYEREGAWLLFAESDRRGLYLPFEAAWMFGAPLAGGVEEARALLVDAAAAEASRVGNPSAFFIGGLVRGGPMHAALRSLASRSRVCRDHPGTDVMMIDLGEGLEAWLGRRSRKFRRTLREATGDLEGLEIVDLSREDPAVLFERLLAIQRKTYKWREGTDIFQIPGYAAFYRRLLEDLHRSGGLRALVARRDGTDLAHLFGGVKGDVFRGLQMSYVEEARDLALGNRLQFENLRRCAGEGIVTYDLGMHAPYKERWADRAESRVGVLWVG
jgi:CelD/BcsL family acetyltransferase involved in cellulose biosynthesis